MKFGLLAGLFWAIDTVILGVALESPSFIVLSLFSGIVSGGLHDLFCAGYINIYSASKHALDGARHALRTKHGRIMCLAALGGGPIGMTGYVIAVQNFGAGYAAIISVLFPAIGAVLSRAFLQDKLPTYRYIFLAISIACIAGMLYEPGSIVTNLPLGIIGGLLAVFGWATEGVVCSYALREDSVDSTIALTLRETTSAIGYAMIILALLISQLLVIDIEMLYSLPLVVLAALFGVSSYLCYYKAIDLLGTARAMSLDMTYSIWSPIIAFVFLGQSLPITSALLGVIAVVCAIIVANGIPRRNDG